MSQQANQLFVSSFTSRLRVRPVIAWLALLQLALAALVGAVSHDIRIETIPMQRIG